MFKAQIAQVQNGFIVALPPTEGEIRAAQVTGRQPEGPTIICKDMDEVCETLRENVE